MEILNSEWKGRLEHWIRTLKADLYEPLGEIFWEAYRTMEQLRLNELSQKEFMPVRPGFSWGDTWEYCWFRGRITLPERAEGKRIVLKLEPGGESALFVNGREFGAYRADWIAEPHHYMVDNTIVRNGKAGDTYTIHMEVYAGHDFPNYDYCATGPVLPGCYEDLNTRGNRRCLGECSFGIWQEEAYQLYLDVTTLYQLLLVLDEDSLRAARVAEALKQFTLLADFEQDRERRLASYVQARQALKGALKAVNGSTAPLFWAVGNAHLDLAWLWPVAETERKTLRTFAAQLRLLEEYPQYRFIQSQPAAYEMCRMRYPDLFDRIREAVKQGGWIADGAMWVEPDTNLAGGEALIRQLIHGKRYYKEVLGVDSRVLWLPDTFGYTAALPQILMGCDVPYLVTQKIFWSYNDGEKFPYHYFYWEGMDGTRVTSFLPTSYTYRTDPAETGRVWKERVQKEDLDAFLLPFGYGDGGGGPTRDHVEYVLRQRDLEGSPRMNMGSVEEFFKRMEEEGGPKHTYVGELYFSAHRGTYTSQTEIKKNNRKSELMLREMEIWSSLGTAEGMKYDLAGADRLWKVLLFHQFHDILPGSSIERVYREANEAHGRLQAQAEQMTREAVGYLLEKDGMCSAKEEGITVWNSLSFLRRALVALPEEYGDGAVTAEGIAVPVDKSPEGVRALVDIPSVGCVSLIPACTKVSMPQADAWQAEDGFHMENDHIAATVDAQGRVVSYVLKASGRQLAAEPMNRFHLYKDVPRYFDAWDIDSNYLQQELPGAFDQEVTVQSRGAEAVLKVSGRIGHSSYTQYLRLAADSKRLEFETCVEWNELHRLLKVSFPVRVHAVNARHEMQFGYVERPVHRSRPYDQDRFEVCNHRYTALCDEAHGAALLNNCKYGISVNGSSMELTLLRAAAGPQLRADNGRQCFTYAFYGWEGSFADSDVIRQGYELNVAPMLTGGKSASREAVHIDRKNVILDTMKPAEDGSGDLILRLYEAAGAAVSAHIRLNLPVASVHTADMLERIQKDLPFTAPTLPLSFRAFEIKTLRLRIK